MGKEPVGGYAPALIAQLQPREGRAVQESTFEVGAGRDRFLQVGANKVAPTEVRIAHVRRREVAPPAAAGEAGPQQGRHSHAWPPPSTASLNLNLDVIGGPAPETAGYKSGQSSQGQSEEGESNMTVKVVQNFHPSSLCY
jgi:hypothetical protein